MQVVRYAETETQRRGVNHREGTFRYKTLGEGVPGTPGNFSLRMVWSQTDFFSPRHQHNFDQVRIQISGTFHFDTDGSMTPGTIGFFPEGTPYGPQISQDDTATLVMQIGGASAGGYLSEPERVATVDRLAGAGRFARGRYFAGAQDPASDAGTDAFQAVWESAMGRKMIYPSRRFERPVLMHPAAVAWQTLPGHAGVDFRRIWSFGERTVGLEEYRLAPGATHTFNGAVSCYMAQGAGKFQARAAEGRYDAFDAFHLAAAESACISAVDETRITVFVHPLFSDGCATQALASPQSANNPKPG